MIKENLEKIEERVVSACNRAGRSRESVLLLAVSKTFPVETIREVYDLGCRSFGENRVMELRDKNEVLPDDISWHLIGHLQHNKVRQAVKVADWIHSIDSIELLERVIAETEKIGRKIHLLFEVNVSGEESKFGISPENLPDVLQKAVEIVSVRPDCGCSLDGFMTMAPLGADEQALHRVFGGLRILRDDMQRRFGLELPQLSMGMSGDFEIAIEEGATIVRVGSAIFGHRAVMIQPGEGDR